MQRFLGGEALWNYEDMIELYQKRLKGQLSEEGGMLALDSSEFVKKGKHSVGVKRQYCGRAGKIENCQSGVFLSYACDRGYAVLDQRLYMPKEWFTEEYAERAKRCRVLEDLMFMTKTEIACELLKRTEETGLFLAKWVA